VCSDGSRGEEPERRQIDSICSHLQKLLPGILSQVEQPLVAGTLVAPQDIFNIGDIAVGFSVTSLVIEIVLAESFNDLRITARVGVGSKPAEEYGLGPAVIIGLRLFKERGSKITISSSMLKCVPNGRCWFLPRIAAVTVDGPNSETPSGSFSRLSGVITTGKLAPCRGLILEAPCNEQEIPSLHRFLFNCAYCCTIEIGIVSAASR
jgi:hypothetical protein